METRAKRPVRWGSRAMHFGIGFPRWDWTAARTGRRTEQTTAVDFPFHLGEDGNFSERDYVPVLSHDSYLFFATGPKLQPYIAVHLGRAQQPRSRANYRP